MTNTTALLQALPFINHGFSTEFDRFLFLETQQRRKIGNLLRQISPMTRYGSVNRVKQELAAVLVYTHSMIAC